LKNRGLARGQIEVADLFRPPLSALNAAAVVRDEVFPCHFTIM
jgi:hypothetical protein